MPNQVTFLKKSSVLEPPKRILIIRSAARVFNQTLEALKTEFQNTHITVLAPESSLGSLKQDPMVDEAIALPVNGRMTILNCGKNLIHKMRSQNFDLAITLYNVEHGIGYSNIDLIAWSAKPLKIRGYNSKGKYITHSGRTIFQKMVREKTSGLWMILNVVGTIVLFTCITAGVLAEALFRKIFQRKHPKTIIE